MPKALITGATGQDAWYLAHLLHEKGYRVYGGIRRAARPADLPDFMETIPLEMTEYESVRRAVKSIQPDEIYHLAAQSHVGESFDIPLYTQEVNGAGTVRLLEVIRHSGIRMYQASTSEMFGQCNAPQSESTPFSPASPYAASKVYAHQMCQMYRRAYDTPVSCGILFNHESPRRPKEFVTRRITSELAAHGTVELGNLEARRDWGHAEDYVRAMWLMLQSDPDDFVIGSGTSRTVGEFAQAAVRHLGGTITSDTTRTRPLDVGHLRADASKARKLLGWEPEISFDELVRQMCAADREVLKPRAEPVAVAA